MSVVTHDVGDSVWERGRRAGFEAARGSRGPRGPVPPPPDPGRGAEAPGGRQRGRGHAARQGAAAGAEDEGGRAVPALAQRGQHAGHPPGLPAQRPRARRGPRGRRGHGAPRPLGCRPQAARAPEADGPRAAPGRRVQRSKAPEEGCPKDAVDVDAVISRVEATFSQFPHERATIDDMGQVAKACGCPLYWKGPLFYSAGGECTGHVSVHRFIAMWRKVLQSCHDDAARFTRLLVSPGSEHLVQEDFVPFVQLAFSWLHVCDSPVQLNVCCVPTSTASSGACGRRLPTCASPQPSPLPLHPGRREHTPGPGLPEGRSGVPLSVHHHRESPPRGHSADLLHREPVLVGEDHVHRAEEKLLPAERGAAGGGSRHQPADGVLFLRALLRHLLQVLGAGHRPRPVHRLQGPGAAQRPRHLHKDDRQDILGGGDAHWLTFPVFLRSGPESQSIEYWFRCMDLDGDGTLSMYELEFFYEEQSRRLDSMAIEALPFEDCLCQMLDLVRPQSEGKITLQDLKKCKQANVFFDTFFNIEKYLDHEQKEQMSLLRMSVPGRVGLSSAGLMPSRPCPQG
ncbi:serine/threonine-protein phosphatase 2A regulatory subunit B'' subunit beta-like isoform X2 [Choloepus didactylus]|uniref:serine/threonine-protein phosphatase 2A regulatory subunit B'' subunit beta-like isoform X2 n=1 Tax=Choloepus didactylus TaxID=27675 RepID=UPI00189D8805|nr:serine/threonine-protein phosphatase 2A regulatory subunit B'' subunit beta-like isoform X2 [Choloepus didactylus]